MDEKKLMDLDALFKLKNPGLYRWVPRFILSYLKRLLHQEETNQFLTLHQQSNAFEFTEALIKELKITFEIFNIENVPATGGCILVCNHPMGALEGVCLTQELGKVRKDLKFIVNDLLLNIHNLATIFVGVNKHGKSSAQSLKIVNDLFSSDKLIVVFPSGMVSRKYNGVIEDLEWKKTFVTRARTFNKPVIPVYIHARNSNFFYNLSNLRTRFGIRANLEMFFLVDEMHKQRGKHLSIVFGKVIEPSTFTKQKTDKEWATQVREEVYQLKNQLK